jgi:hypothetical protein
MFRKLRLFDWGVCLMLAFQLCAWAIGAYRAMGWRLTSQDVLAPQSIELLFRESLYDVVTSTGWLIGIGLLVVLVGTILKIKSKRLAEDPLYWFRFGAFTLWLLLMPVARGAGNYFALWHPLSDEMIALVNLALGGLGFSGFVLMGLDLLLSRFKRPTSPPFHAQRLPE